MRQSFEQKPEEAWEAVCLRLILSLAAPGTCCRRSLSMFVAEWPSGHLFYSSSWAQVDCQMTLHVLKISSVCYHSLEGDRKIDTSRAILFGSFLGSWIKGKGWALLVQQPYTFFFLKDSLSYSGRLLLKIQFYRLEERNKNLSPASTFAMSVCLSLSLYIYTHTCMCIYMYIYIHTYVCDFLIIMCLLYAGIFEIQSQVFWTSWCCISLVAVALVMWLFMW
jgi:hypothetical protein